ncbi:MAG TPA: nickel-type superoxide dismutase maturation protease [Pyrinomonadaceae bacterium]|nr:nickel-type superoxide dismutase maturation protease [Pyrinomonadaceae bacterium]
MENELPEIVLNEENAENFSNYKLFRVEGDSMFPNLKNGEFVLINPDFEPKIGDIVLAAHPFKKSVKIIKRITEINAENRYFLIGDNPTESTDSRSFGTILRKDILGKVTAKVKENLPVKHKK